MNSILVKIIAEDAESGVQTGSGMGVGGAFGITDGYDTPEGNADARNPVPFIRGKKKFKTVQKRNYPTMNKLTESIVNPTRHDLTLSKIISEGDEKTLGTPGKSRAEIISERIAAARGERLDECKTMKGKLAAKKAAIAKAKGAKEDGKEDGAKAKLAGRKQKLKEAVERIREKRRLLEESIKRGDTDAPKTRSQKLQEAVQNLRQKRMLESRAKRIEEAKKRILEARRNAGSGAPLNESKFNKSRELLSEARSARLRKQRLCEARERLCEARKKAAAAPKAKTCPKCKKPCDCKTGKCACPPVKK